jgi:hypothetical protein
MPVTAGQNGWNNTRGARLRLAEPSPGVVV